MTDAHMHGDSDVARIGRDQVLRQGDRLVIRAASALDRWDVSPHRPTVVRYGDELFVLVGAEPDQPSGVRYLLDRVDEPPMNAGYTHTYDVDAVLQRDLDGSLRRVEGGLRLLLWLAQPVLGLLPSGVKVDLLMRTGLHPVPVTQASLYPFYLFAITTALVTVVQVWTRFFPGEVLKTMLLITAVLAPDALVRQGRINIGGVHQYGLFEWLVRRIRPAQRLPSWWDPNQRSG